MVDFGNIFKHTVPLDDFRLKWRFSDPKHDQLPMIHLEQLMPLNTEASKFIWDYIQDANLHADMPFKNGLFRTIFKMKMLVGNEPEVKKWLYQRWLPFEKQVFLSWHPTEAMIVPWKIFIKYFDSFYYSCADDLTVIDQSLNWALLFFHDDEIYFGTNEEFTSRESSDDFL